MFLIFCAPWVCQPLPMGLVHVYKHHFLAHSTLKSLGQSNPNQILTDFNEFKGNVKLAKFAFCAFTRPIYPYQVSVYRTIGPRVYIVLTESSQFRKKKENNLSEAQTKIQTSKLKEHLKEITTNTLNKPTKALMQIRHYV